MLETLKFVRAAVCKNDLQPTLQHFRIKDGTISAYNGLMAICAPLPTGLDCAPHAGQFLKAIAACEETIALHIEGERLMIRSGSFKTSVDLLPDLKRYPALDPEGEVFPVQSGILPMLRKLVPFMGTDPVRPWSCGVLFANQSVFATNNVCIVEHYSPVPFPIIANMPAEAVKELLRLNVEPVSVQADPQRVTFHLPGGAWINTRLLCYEWPDLQRVFDLIENVALEPMSDELLDAVEKVVPFADEWGRIYFHKGAVGTKPEGEAGTTVDTADSPGYGAYRSSHLTALRGVATKIGLQNYPLPIPFYGDKLRGVFQGYTQQ